MCTAAKRFCIKVIIIGHFWATVFLTNLFTKGICIGQALNPARGDYRLITDHYADMKVEGKLLMVLLFVAIIISVLTYLSNASDSHTMKNLYWH